MGTEGPKQKNHSYLVTFPRLMPGTLVELVLYPSLCLLKPRDVSCDQLWLLLYWWAFFSRKHQQGQPISNGEQSVSRYINSAKKAGCFAVK